MVLGIFKLIDWKIKFDRFVVLLFFFNFGCLIVINCDKLFLVWSKKRFFLGEIVL